MRPDANQSLSNGQRFSNMVVRGLLRPDRHAGDVDVRLDEVVERGAVDRVGGEQLVELFAGQLGDPPRRENDSSSFAPTALRPSSSALFPPFALRRMTRTFFFLSLLNSFLRCVS